MINLTELISEAEKKKPEWQAYFKKNKKRLEKMDLQVQALHDEIMERTDCLSCGNCCRSLGPRLTDKDVERMAKSLRMKSVDFIRQYLKIDEDKDMVFKSMPCPFLGEDNYCAVYEDRPKACREYPHTDRRRFYQIYNLTVKNAETCPVAFEVLEKLKKM